MNVHPLPHHRESEQELHHERARAPDGQHPHPRPAKPAGHGATWTAERVAQLKACLGAGLSCSQVAAEIGVTRNAVIGKMSRLGLSRPKNGIVRERAPKRPASRARSVRAILARHHALLEFQPQPYADNTIHNGRGCSLLDLAPGNCRWPINEPGTADFCFCGNPQLEGLPYCLGHARIAYKSPGRARD